MSEDRRLRGPQSMPPRTGTIQDGGTAEDDGMAGEDPTGMAEALAAEHAAIFAYGVIGAHLDGEDATAARAAEEAHRSRRDALLLRLSERGAPAPVAAASYELPFEVAGAEDALRLATLVEERVGAVWRAVLPGVAAEDRAEALAALVDAAVRATGWRRAAGVEPATVAFPGTP